MELAGCITSQDARSYVLANGWLRIKGKRDDIAVFGRPEPSRKQLIVPMDPNFDDYASRMAELVMRLAEVEQRSAQEVLNDLLVPGADVLRYRLSSPDTIKGSLPLNDAVRLLEGVKMSLLASAHSVLSPQSYHPRMSRSEAVSLLDACHLGQTERGSFTVALTCPLRAVEEHRQFSGRQQPFARSATSLLMQSANRLVKAIEADDVVAAIEDHENEPVISANLCNALLHMQPHHERSFLELSVTWASILPPEPAIAPPRRVRVRSEYFPIIETIYGALQVNEPKESLFVGKVDALNGNLDDAGRVRGEVTVSLLYHDGDDPKPGLKARLDLDTDDYETALQAHRVGAPVKFTGILWRGPRVHKISDVQGFTHVER